MILNLRSALWLFVTSLLLPEPRAAGQTLRLSLGAGPPDGPATIEISLRSPAGKEPSSLQWVATIPTAQLDFANPIASSGPAAEVAGKSVACAVKDKDGAARTSLCVLSGGEQPIHDGVIAVLRLKIDRHSRRGSYRIRIDHGISVSKDLTQTTLSVAETLVIVRAP